MIKQIRDKTPFVLLAISLMSAIGSYFELLYPDFLVYLSEIVGYSIFTNIFMYSVYMNKKYCMPTKIAVVSLFSLNIINIICTFFDAETFIYDITIMLASIIIILFLKTDK